MSAATRSEHAGEVELSSLRDHLAFYNASFNLWLVICEQLTAPTRRAFVVYPTLIGNCENPGFLRALSLTF